MKLFQLSKGLLVGLALFSGLIVSAAPVSAATQGVGLSVKVGRPGTSWSSTLAVNTGEAVNVLITYTNQGEFLQKYVTISDSLPAGASFKAGSAYLFTPSAPAGVQQADTLIGNGISTGALKPGETAFIQFQMALPASISVACGSVQLTNQVSGTSYTGSKTYGANTAITVNQPCAVTTTPPASPPVTPAITAVVTPAVATTVNTTTARVASANTTVPAQSHASTVSTIPVVAATNSAADSKTLVNTGPGNVLFIALIATVVGAVGSRFVLYRLLGA